jgi:hypothetical protein
MKGISFDANQYAGAVSQYAIRAIIEVVAAFEQRSISCQPVSPSATSTNQLASIRADSISSL